jgi:hypothetical protein
VVVEMKTPIHKSKPLLFCSALALLVGFSWWAFAKEHPSDAQLKREFAQRRGDFEKLVKMSDEDKHVIRIASDFTWLDTDASWPRNNVGFSPERWNAYRSLFGKLGISHGLSRREDYPSSVFFLVSGIGIVPSGSGKGFVYSGQPLFPIRDSLDHFRPKDSNKDIFTFELIAPNWYLFLEDNR